MSLWRSTLLFAAVIGGLTISACSTTQTTSGRAYLAGFPAKPNQTDLMQTVGPQSQRILKDGQWYVIETQPKKPPTFEDRLREVASIEPLLRFPARIGLARVENGGLTSLPADEASEWQKLTEKLGPEFGSIVPISPLIVEMASTSPVSETGYQGASAYSWQPKTQGAINQVVSAIRLGAARQHVDAVLIYEVCVNTKEEDNALSWANFTILGAALLPGYEIAGDAQATALLIDVRNAYPYGHTTVGAEDSSMASAVMTRNVTRTMSKTIRQKAVANLVTEVEAMTRRLKTELAALPAATASK